VGSALGESSSELNEIAAVAPVAREPGAPSSALAPPLLTAAPTRSWSPPMGGGTDTPSPPALAPHSATRAAVRQNAAAASPVGMMTLRGKLRRHQPRVLLCRRASDPLRTGGTYAVQVTSERSAAEADASFRALRAKFPNQLGGREPIVRRTDSLCVNGKGGWNVPHTAGCRRQLPHSRKLRARSTLGRETAGAHLRNSSSLHDEREIS
jgi:hypothetical protein